MLTTEVKSNGIAMANDTAEILEKVIIGGDLSKLSPTQRVLYYNKVCESLGLNPLTCPFNYAEYSGKLTLYAKKDATEQLRKIHNVSITKLETKSFDNGVYVVTAYASLPNGKQDVSTGALHIANLKGEALSNALLKTETKAKRRVTLSIVGLGMLDESEIDSVPNVRFPIHIESGETIKKLSSHQDIQEKISQLIDLITLTDTSSEVVQKWLDRAGAKSLDDLTEDQIDKCLQWLNAKKN